MSTPSSRLNSDDLDWLISLLDSCQEELEAWLSTFPAAQRESILRQIEERAGVTVLPPVMASSPTGQPIPASPMDLAKVVWGDKWKVAPHLTLLNQKLVDVAAGRVKRLVITMPPRNGKSLLTSENFPAWYLGTFPDRRIILASYGADFASEWGRKARAILEEYGPSLFGVKVSKDSSAANRWDIEGSRGGMQTAGVGGPITGKGADLLIIDDPVKNSEEANSFVYRQKTWEWYQSTAYTRLEPAGAVVLIQTRWHSDDLAGRVLAENGRTLEPWEVVNFPAIAETHDEIGRKPGDPLWPERYSLEDLRRIQGDVGVNVWASLYQQTPLDETGGRIKKDWLRYWTSQGDYYRPMRADRTVIKPILPRECQRIMTVDSAGSSDDITKERRGKPTSYAVISVFDFYRDGGLLIWRDLRRERWEYPDFKKQVIEMYELHNPSWIGIEDVNTGRALLQELRGLPTRALSHEHKDKLTRAARALNDLEKGRVFIPEQTPEWSKTEWMTDLIKELLRWTGEKDEVFDQGDTLAYAANHVLRIDQSKPMVIGRGFVTARV